MTTADAAVSGITSDYLTVPEVATILRVQPDLVRRLCKSGEITATKLGGRQGWRIHRDSLAAFTSVGQTAPTRPRPARKAAK